MRKYKSRKKPYRVVNRSIISRVLIISASVIALYISLQTIWSVQKIFIQNQTIKNLSFTIEKYKKNEQLLTPTPLAFPSISVTPTPLPSKTNSLPHENLPGFAMTFATDWQVFMKQFRDRDTHGFDNTYTDTCAENCMGIRVSQGATFLELIFDEAYDSDGERCSNSVGISKISNDWYRIKDKAGYLYAWKPRLDVTIDSSNSTGYYYGTAKDEWSVLKNTHYAICLSRYGYFLSQHSPVYPGVDGKGIPLLLEFPRIMGNPSEQQLKVMDQMIGSIRGLEE